MSMNSDETPVFKNLKKSTVAILSVIAVLVIGDIDYLTGYKISLLVVYILPLGFATIYVGRTFALFLAFLSVAISLSTDLWSGIPHVEFPEMFWSGAISLVVFIVAVALLNALKVSLLRSR